MNLRSTGTLLLASLAAAVALTASASAQHSADDLRAVERAWLDAYEQNDVEAMRRIVADEFIITYASGQQRDKAQTIASLDPARGDDPNSRMFTEDDTVRFFGDDVAVITGLYVYEGTDAEGNTYRSESLYTDTYMIIDGRWQVIASHLSKPEQSE
jgi:uncharacterized protein (TIGR02246 family)